MYELSDTLDEGPLGLAANYKYHFEKLIFKWNCLVILMYLSAADGKIAWQESAFIRDYMEYNLTTDEIHQFIVEEQIYSTEFEEKVPLSM